MIQLVIHLLVLVGLWVGLRMVVGPAQVNVRLLGLLVVPVMLGATIPALLFLPEGDLRILTWLPFAAFAFAFLPARLSPEEPTTETAILDDVPGPNWWLIGLWCGWWLFWTAILWATRFSGFNPDLARRLLVMGIPIVLVGPWLEELYVRGSLWLRLPEALGPWGRVACTTVVFACMHDVRGVTVSHALMLYGVGCLLSIVRTRASLGWVFLCHACCNAFALTKYLLLSQS